MRLILVRHGESEGNARGVVQGRVDYGLSAVGRLQAEVTAERLAEIEIERVISSPLARAMQTANILARPHNLDVASEPGLSEYDIGTVAGMTWTEIRERYPALLDAYRRSERPRFPGEEGRDEFRKRVLEVTGRLRDSRGASLAVTHGGVVSLLCTLALDLDVRRPGAFQVANCSITILSTDRAGHLVIEQHNDRCHLDGMVTQVDRG